MFKKIFLGMLIIAAVFFTINTEAFAHRRNGWHGHSAYHSSPYQYRNNHNRRWKRKYHRALKRQVYRQGYRHGSRRSYYHHGYHGIGYNNTPYYYNNYGYDSYGAYRAKKIIKYGALGAGAGYLLSDPGSRGRDTAIGAGLGAALGALSY